MSGRVGVGADAVRVVGVIGQQGAVSGDGARQLALSIATGGESGLALARDLKPHAITLDIYLPDIEGWRVLELKIGAFKPAEVDQMELYLRWLDRHERRSRRTARRSWRRRKRSARR